MVPNKETYMPFSSFIEPVHFGFNEVHLDVPVFC